MRREGRGLERKEGEEERSGKQKYRGKKNIELSSEMAS